MRHWMALSLLLALAACGSEAPPPPQQQPERVFQLVLEPNPIRLPRGSRQVVTVTVNDAFTDEQLHVVASDLPQGLSASTIKLDKFNLRAEMEIISDVETSSEGVHELPLKIERYNLYTRERIDRTSPPVTPASVGLEIGPAVLGRVSLSITTPESVPWTVHLRGPASFAETFSGNGSVTSKLIKRDLPPGAYELEAERTFTPSPGSLFASHALHTLYQAEVNSGGALAVRAGEVVSVSAAFKWRGGTGYSWVVDEKNNLLRAIPSRVLSGQGISGMLELPVDVSQTPGRIAMDGQGHLWLARTNSGSLARYAPEQLASVGTQVPTTVLEGISSPQGLAFDREGNLWVASGDAVMKLPASGLNAPGTHTAQPALTLEGGMSNARFPTFDGSGNLYVLSAANLKVVKFTPEQLTGTGSVSQVPAAVFTSSTGLTHPTGMAFHDSGDLIVANAETGMRGLGDLVRFPSTQLQASGEVALTPLLRLESSALKQSAALAFDNLGTLWVGSSEGLLGFNKELLVGSGTFQVSPSQTVLFNSWGRLGGVVMNPAPPDLPLPR